MPVVSPPPQTLVKFSKAETETMALLDSMTCQSEMESENLDSWSWWDVFPQSISTMQLDHSLTREDIG